MRIEYSTLQDSLSQLRESRFPAGVYEIPEFWPVMNEMLRRENEQLKELNEQMRRILPQ